MDKPVAAAAGHLAVILLSLIRRMPIQVARKLLAPALKAYPYLRPGHASRLRACFAASPFQSLTVATYYAERLDLFLQGLKWHGASLPSIQETGVEHYFQAIEANRPIALIGLHAGLLELQHRIPAAPKERPFFILTAPAFSPPLTGFMARGRERDGKRILWIGKGGLEKGLRTVLAANGVLALMADQHPGPADECEYLRLWDKIRVPWPARLLRFLDAHGFICLPVSTFIDRDGVVRFTYHPAIRPDAETIRAYLETAISESPGQWNWSYPKISPSVPPSGPGMASDPRGGPEIKKDGAVAPSCESDQ